MWPIACMLILELVVLPSQIQTNGSVVPIGILERLRMMIGVRGRLVDLLSHEVLYHLLGLVVLCIFYLFRASLLLLACHTLIGRGCSLSSLVSGLCCLSWSWMENIASIVASLIVRLGLSAHLIGCHCIL